MLEDMHHRLIQGRYKLLGRNKYEAQYVGKGLRIRVHENGVDIAAAYAFDRWSNSRDFVIAGHPVDISRRLHKARVEIALNRKIDNNYYQYPTIHPIEL